MLCAAAQPGNTTTVVQSMKSSTRRIGFFRIQLLPVKGAPPHTVAGRRALIDYKLIDQNQLSPNVIGTCPELNPLLLYDWYRDSMNTLLRPQPNWNPPPAFQPQFESQPVVPSCTPDGDTTVVPDCASVKFFTLNQFPPPMR